MVFKALHLLWRRRRRRSNPRKTLEFLEPRLVLAVGPQGIDDGDPAWQVASSHQPIDLALEAETTSQDHVQTAQVLDEQHVSAETYEQAVDIVFTTYDPDGLTERADEPLAAELPGDANGDGIVNIGDLGIFSSNWFTSGRLHTQGDFNGDTQVAIADLDIFSANWFKSVGSPAADASQAAPLDMGVLLQPLTAAQQHQAVIEPATTLATPGAWMSQGPRPAEGGQVENIADGEVVGAIHTVVADPTDADILYVGATNGGIWKTTSATAASPNWIPLTDDFPSLSIGALQLDPTDATHQTLVAGIGRYSSFGRRGGDRVGVLRTTNGGSSWTHIDGGGVLVGKNISGIAARGNTIVVSVNTADDFTFPNFGIFRSTNGGATFTQISVGNGSTTGLPGGASYDLASDPSDPAILYTSTVFSNFVGGANGIYKSTDTGATWTKVSDSAIDSLINDATSNLEIAVGTSNNVYAAIINGGNPVGFFRSGDGGTTWTQMDTPTTNENGFDVGLNPRGSKGPGEGASPEEIAGGQGTIHFSILADPTDVNIVYVGGDRQPLSNGDTGGFPNSIGAFNFTGRLFRGDASQAAGSQWVHLTHSNSLGPAGGGTASSSAPHADSREMVFDANGNIIQVDDGGIYRRTLPRSDMGDWFSIIGDLAVTEAHDVAYDPISNIIITGNQDTGTTEQLSPGSNTWRSVSTADGGDVLVDAISLAGSNQSIRYSSFQDLQLFRRRIVDSNNNVLSTVFPALSVTSGQPFQAQFDTPVALNNVAPTRLLFGGTNGLYESFDQGDSLTPLAFIFTPGSTSHPLDYGGRSGGIDNPDVVYAGDQGGNVRVRTTSGGSFTSTNPDLSSDDPIRDVRMDPDEWMTAFALDENQVFFTSNAGSGWSDITTTLFSFGVSSLYSLEVVNGIVDAIVVGTNQGVYASLISTLGSWFSFGAELPNAPVWDLDYDAADDVLVVGTLGRGAWILPNASAMLGLPPQVTGVAVSGTAWTTDFVNLLIANGHNQGRFEISVGTGAAQLASLPWSNLNQIHITFSEDVQVAEGDLSVSGVITPNYPIKAGSFSYDATTHTATWELASALSTVDEITILLTSANVTSIATGENLDGEWDNPTNRDDPTSDTFPSGDDVAGGDFAFRLHVLPGDANGDGIVNIGDLGIFSANWFTSGKLQTQGDFNGDTLVNIADLGIFSAHWFETVGSTAQPAATDTLTSSNGPSTTGGSQGPSAVLPAADARRPDPRWFLQLLTTNGRDERKALHGGGDDSGLDMGIDLEDLLG